MAVDLPPPVRDIIRRYARDDADLVELVEETTGAVRYAIDKALAHRADPQQFPLAADPDSLERVLLGRFAHLPAAHLNTLGAQARSRLALTPAGATAATRQANAAQRRARYGVAGGIEPAGSEPTVRAMQRLRIPADLRARGKRVAQRRQGVRAVAVPARGDGGGHGRPRVAASARADRPKIGGGRGGIAGGDEARPQRPAKLRLTVSDVRVLDKTNEIFRDEISVGGVLLNPITGERAVVLPVDLGKFRGKDKKNDFQAVQICELEMADAANVPQYYFGRVFLAEIDRRKGRGGFEQYIRENGDLVTDEVAKAIGAVAFSLAAAIAGAVGGAMWLGATTTALAVLAGIGGAIAGVIVGAVVGAAVVLLFANVYSALSKDEIFGAQDIGQSVEPNGDLALATTQTITFERPKSSYDVTFRWDVVMEPGEPGPTLPEPVGVLPPVTEDQALVNLLDKVDHVVVLMLENRSFDHLLGYLTIDRGREDVNGLQADMFNIDSTTGTKYFVHPMADTVFEFDPPHHVGAVRKSMSGEDPPMGGFIDAYVGKDGFDRLKHRPDDVMGYHRAEQVPVFDFLATYFAVCDNWQSSFPGNTWINRTIAMSGEPARDESGKPYTGNEMPVLKLGDSARSFFRLVEDYNATLREDETRVEWKNYRHDFSTGWCVDPGFVAMNGPHDGMIDDFLDDLAAGTLPQVSWLDPNYVDVGRLGDGIRGDDPGVPETRFPLTANDDHPPTDLAHGQALLALLVFSIMQSPLWDKILFVVTYDEHGGMYDHVHPRSNPDPEDVDFDTLGMRVPTLVLSPYVECGAVCTVEYDHTSIIKTILTRFCRRNGAIDAPSSRVERAPHLGHVLTGTQPRYTSAARNRDGRGTIGRPTTDGGQAGRGLPRRIREDVLFRLGRRVIDAQARPVSQHPPTDLERDFAAARVVLHKPIGKPTAPGRPVRS